MKRQQTIVSEKEILKLGGVDKGYKFERTKHEHGDREKIFYKQWKKENKQLRWLNFGQGILQDLFAITGNNPFNFMRGGLIGWKLIINRRDRYIVATVMQWLGTNCGWCWLEETLRKCGYRLEKIEREEKIENRKKNVA